MPDSTRIWLGIRQQQAILAPTLALEMQDFAKQEQQINLESCTQDSQVTCLTLCILILRKCKLVSPSCFMLSISPLERHPLSITKQRYYSVKASLHHCTKAKPLVSMTYMYVPPIHPSFPDVTTTPSTCSQALQFHVWSILVLQLCLKQHMHRMAQHQHIVGSQNGRSN